LWKCCITDGDAAAEFSDVRMPEGATTRTAGGTLGSIEETTYMTNADRGSNFRVSGCQYIYNLAASALGVGKYRGDILINGTVVGNAVFALK
jgi:hypothetical protein